MRKDTIQSIYWSIWKLGSFQFARFMSDLGYVLARLGISQYLESFIEEGFETWETVLDITESDL